MRATAKTADNAHNSAQQRHQRTAGRQAIRAYPEPRNAAHAMLGGKNAMLAGRGGRKVLLAINSRKTRVGDTQAGYLLTK